MTLVSRTQQIRRYALIGAVLLACVHIVARIAWSIVPMFNQCTERLVTTRMLSLSRFEVRISSHVLYGEYARFENYPYDSTSALVFSHIYSVLTCAAVAVVILVALSLKNHFEQPRDKRGETKWMWGMGATLVSLVSMLMSFGAIHFHSQLQVLCGFGI